ncbi:MAG: Crp/Fnr family transcriptional regulator [Chloroflexi bacterium]|nr:Crp/Fnr family transcriptional regulator [Chloroflexota bacterium]
MTERASTLPRLLHSLDARAVRQLAPYLQSERYERGQMILIEGDSPAALYFVQEGLVRLVQVSAEGRIFVLDHVGPGECLNLSSALEAGPLTYSAEAVVDTRALILTRNRLAEVLRANPGLYRAFADQLAHDLRVLSRIVRELALHPVSARLARFLLEQAEGRQPHTRWTQESIAASIGSVRDVVGRTLRGFMEEGLLRKVGGQMVIANHAELERIARGE